MQLRLQRAEHVRARAQQAAVTGGSMVDVTTVTAGDPVVVPTAWASFVPFLAHPVMASTARAGMDVLEHVPAGQRPRPMVA